MADLFRDSLLAQCDNKEELVVRMFRVMDEGTPASSPALPCPDLPHASDGIHSQTATDT